MAAETSRELGVQAASSVEEVLSNPAISAVLIATPTPTHVDLIIAAARAGKAVLCEKPIDLDMARVLECEAAIRGLGRTIMIGFNRRFDPSFRSLRERVQAGEIGRLEQVIITSRDPSPPPATYVATSGGLFRDMTIHDFDMARYLVGDIAEVHAMGAVLVDPAIGEAGDIDSAMVTLRSRAGALVHINNSRRCVYGYDQRLEVFGSGGMLTAGNRHATTVQSFGSASTGAADVALPFFIERYAEAYSAEISHFLDCVSQRRVAADQLRGWTGGAENSRRRSGEFAHRSAGPSRQSGLRLTRCCAGSMQASGGGLAASSPSACCPGTCSRTDSTAGNALALFATDADSASALGQALFHGRWWFWPVLAAQAIAACVVRPIAEQADAWRPVARGRMAWNRGVAAQGWFIGVHGWSYDALTQAFGDLDDRQFGMGWGGCVTFAAFVVLTTTGLALRGRFGGDRFVAGAVGLLVASILLFTVWPVLTILGPGLVRARRSDDGCDVPANGFFSRRSGVSPASIPKPRAAWPGTRWCSVSRRQPRARCSALRFALIVTRTGFRFKQMLRVLTVLPIITPPFVIGLGADPDLRPLRPGQSMGSAACSASQLGALDLRLPRRAARAGASRSRRSPSWC